MDFFQLHPNIRIRIVTSFLTRAVGTMIFPFMAIYFAEKLGKGLAGILLLVTIIAQILTSFYGGYLADRYGRKIVMVYAQVALVMSFAVMCLANSPLLDSAWLTFAMMLLQSICNGMINPAADAMLIDVSTKENRTFMYSISYWSTNLSIAIGALFGGLFFASHRFTLFLLLTMISLITLMLLVFFVQETYHRQPDLTPTTNQPGILRGVWQNYVSVMGDRRFLLYSLGGLLFIALEFQTPNYVAVRLQQEFIPQHLSLFDWGSIEMTGIKVLSMMQMENTILVVCLSLLVTHVIKKYKDTVVLYSGVIMYTIGYTIISYSNTLWLIAAAMLVATIGELMHVPVRQSYLAEIVKDEARSSYMAVNGLVNQGAKALGALGISAGAFLSSEMMTVLLLLMGIVGLLLTRSVIVSLKREKNEKLREMATTLQT
ncbi:MFS transporter [Brevibacillus fluminis]|uniref:MFS transporter n=1 Tax=Brevibacillus fluminis TaxID=511487 RepID=A0A3M8D9E9_9BACL|nr:MFS transporter [Brevibacillus fluminis]RNB84662.1 MFS transporter [Brevibacillus fluminis]